MRVAWRCNLGGEWYPRTGGEEREIRNTESKRRVGKGWMLTPEEELICNT
jgi:hypothetical protein